MNRFFRMMVWPLTSTQTDAKHARLVCWITSAVALVLGMYKLTTLPLNEAELFIGTLLVFVVAMIGVLIGLVLPTANARDENGPSNRCS